MLSLFGLAEVVFSEYLAVLLFRENDDRSRTRYAQTYQKRLALHARSISFRHPFSGKELTFETKVPVYFNQLVASLINECMRSDRTFMPMQTGH